MFYTNCNGLRNKLSQLRLDSSCEKYDVICVTETMLNDEILNAEISIANFNIFRSDRLRGHGGGSCIYVRNTFSAEYVHDFIANDCMSIKLTLNSVDIVLICIYRSPSLSHENNICLINSIDQYISSIPVNQNIIMVGDFNLPNVDWDNGIVICPTNTSNKSYLVQQAYLDLFRLHNLTWSLDNSMISRCRLVNNNLQMSNLDQILFSDSSMFKNIILKSPLCKSDHLSVLCVLNFTTNRELLTTNKLNWGKVKTEDLCYHGNNTNWKFNTAEIHDMWVEIHTKLMTITDTVPKLRTYINAAGQPIHREPFCSASLRKAKQTVDKLWHKMNKDPTPLNHNLAAEASRVYEEKLQQNMVNYERKITSKLMTNPKAFYIYISSKRKVRNTISEIRDQNQTLVTSAEGIANELGAFFQSTFTDEPEGPIPLLDIDAKTKREKHIGDLIITKDKVRDILTNLNISKSHGPDNIHPKLLKALSLNDNFIEALTVLFQKSFDSGEIPEMWKLANVVALHKKGDKLSGSNYRPISLTCTLSKCYEKIVRDHILNHVEKFICPQQHGFRSKRSCFSNLLECMNRAYSILDKHESLDIIYLDFMKAFDSVPHKRLISKLRSYGITGKTLKVIEDFLTNRVFRVRIGDKYSKLFKVLSGVPQGTILGPLLFIIYINDLPGGLSSFVSLFADDLKLLTNSKNATVAQDDLDYLTNWQNTWLLKFNTEDLKCKVLHVGKNNPQIDYNLNGLSLPKSSEEKDLGVIISKQLTWESHISMAINKAMSVMGWVSRNIISKEKSVMLNIYKSLIRPNLEYCVQLWNLTARHGNWSTILSIEKVQRDFTRRISGLGLLSYKDRLSELGLTTLLERRARGDLIECFKIYRGFNNYGDNLLNVSRSGYKLIKVPKSGDRQADFFPDRIINYWNKLPDGLKDASTVNNFKMKLENYKLVNQNKLSGNFWELSEEVFRRIESTNRDSYVQFMLNNPSVAHRRQIGI